MLAPPDLLPVQGADPPPLRWLGVEAEGRVAVAGVKVCYWADQEGVWRRGGLGLDFSWVCPGVSPPASQGAALAGDAAAEENEEDQGGDWRDQDVEPPLCLQLGPATTQATEEQDILEPFRLTGLVPSDGDIVIHDDGVNDLEVPVAGEVEEVTVLAGEAVGGGGIVLALEPAALEAGPVVPDVDRTHPSRRDLEAGLVKVLCELWGQLSDCVQCCHHNKSFIIIDISPHLPLTAQLSPIVCQIALCRGFPVLIVFLCLFVFPLPWMITN